MRATSQSGWRRWLGRVLVVIALGAGALGFFSEATYSVAVVGSYYWLGTGILFALLAIAAMASDR